MSGMHFYLALKQFFSSPSMNTFNLVIDKIMSLHNFTSTISSLQNENKLYVYFSEETLIFSKYKGLS